MYDCLKEALIEPVYPDPVHGVESPPRTEDVLDFYTKICYLLEANVSRYALIFAASVACFSQAALAGDAGAYLGAGFAAGGTLTACDNTKFTCNNATTNSNNGNLSLVGGYDFNKYV